MADKFLYHSNRTLALISHASKVVLKILQARLQQYVNRELDVQAGFRKGRGTRDQIANIRWIIEKAREFQKKYLLLLYWLCQSLWLCGSQQTVENSYLKRWEYQTILPVSTYRETCMRVKSQQLEPCMKQLTGSGLRKEYGKAVFVVALFI